MEQQQAVYRAQPGHRAVELVAIGIFFGFAIPLLVRLALHAPHFAWFAAAAFIGSLIFADFLSGVVHWAADTWGDFKTPILGPSFIQPFREHHSDEKAITRHDFVETNGNNCTASLWVLIVAWYLPENPEEGWTYFAESFLTGTALWIFATNQIHKWSHMDHPPIYVRILQKLRIILPPVHHSLHHSAPYAVNYCITTGWMNRPLQAIGFFPKMEWLVSKLTGLKPRVDDLRLIDLPAVTEKPL